MTVHAFDAGDALGGLDAVGVAARIAAGEASVGETIDAAIARAEKVNPQLNAIQVAAFERARRDAEMPRPARSYAVPFAGVPTFVKDNTDVAGLATNQGSLAVNGRPAPRHAPFTRQLLAQGFAILGKSTMPEFGFNASTEYVDLPPTRNPWNLDHSCGASSGGAAALVAAGVVPIAHGNDGGGSIRIPAAACGLVGLKVTRGRVVDAVEARRLPINIISNGVLSRSVRDTAQFLAAAERFRPNPRLPLVGLVEAPAARRLRVGLVLDSVTGVATDADTRTAVLDTAALLEQLGHTVVEAPLPVDGGFVDDFTLYWSFLAFATRAFGKKTFGPGFDKSKTDPFTNGLARHFSRHLREAPLALRRLKRCERRYREAFARFDVMLSPTVAYCTPRLGHLSPAVPFDVMFERLIAYAAFTPLNNVVGSPALSLPLGSSTSGMPIGVHFAARHGAERTLLELAYELEAAQPFRSICPSLAM